MFIIYIHHAPLHSSPLQNLKQEAFNMASNTRTAGMIADNQWFVQEIIAQRIGANFLLELLVVWEGYTVEEATWEPSEHIHGDILGMWFNMKKELVDLNDLEEEMEADAETMQATESETREDSEAESESDEESVSEFTPDTDMETSESERESEYDSEQDADFEWDD
ncbi:hypothetical protein BDY17DRAFT_300106 [Neohortaea acidophila]|uniref:Chromo domain-containing protein n=1 Tax=Neohortaea acidophila TaxID=245834 RepID=A0A6A6PPJ6_9PEZI|nr:uncharacterized protein BDY17DRAFT_300106 [Neohortaea acidophila]KAF2482018.1 hypothetical protein BDY17DRAFT_300106 [Neohortaea acidophila]